MIVNLLVATGGVAAGMKFHSESEERALRFREASRSVEPGMGRSRLRALLGDPLRCRAILRVAEPESELWTYVHPARRETRLQILLEGGRVKEARFVTDEGPATAPRVEPVAGYWARTCPGAAATEAAAPAEVPPDADVLALRGVAC